MADEWVPLATALRDARNRLQLTQGHAAEWIGVDISAYRKWEQGRGSPSESNWPHIARVLHLRLAMMARQATDGERAADEAELLAEMTHSSLVRKEQRRRVELYDAEMERRRTADPAEPQRSLIAAIGRDVVPATRRRGG